MLYPSHQVGLATKYQIWAGKVNNSAKEKLPTFTWTDV